jgi:ABC-type sugar transport system substrate-binding protein
MLKRLTLLFSSLLLALAVVAPASAEAPHKTFYWISHGSPADPVWTYFLAGAKLWAHDTGNTVNTSFHNGDVASQQKTGRAACAAQDDGNATTSPDPGSLVKVAAEAKAAGIPIINFNTPDPTAPFDAYVGGDLVLYGANWARYLVDKHLVKAGDFVWMPVEIPGATYGVQEAEGIASVFKPLGITWEVTEATLDQAEAKAAGIPIINFNTPDPTAPFDAYVGGDLVLYGANWARYLVDKHLVKAGDFVWMPVEIPGATYGVQEAQGIASVFKPLGITWEVTEATLDQAEAITRMVDYMTANGKKIKAIIGLGDLVTGSIKRVFDQAGVAKGSIPVIGWGNSLDTTQEVLQGYVNAAQWQDPQATSYMALSMAAMAASGVPPGFNVITGKLYEADAAKIYEKILSGK